MLIQIVVENKDQVGKFVVLEIIQVLVVLEDIHAILTLMSVAQLAPLMISVKRSFMRRFNPRRMPSHFLHEPSS